MSDWTQGQAAGQGTGSATGQNSELEAAHGLLGELTGNSASGVQSLLDRLRGAGLGSQVDSWVGNGPNQAVSPEQLQPALGGMLDGLAQRLGMNQQQLLALAAQLLPVLISAITPQGRVPQNDGEMPRGGLGGILGGLLQGQGGLGGLLGGLLRRL